MGGNFTWFPSDCFSHLFEFSLASYSHSRLYIDIPPYILHIALYFISCFILACLWFCLPWLDCELLEGRVISYSSQVKIIWVSETHITTILLFYSHLINDYHEPVTQNRGVKRFSSCPQEAHGLLKNLTWRVVTEPVSSLILLCWPYWLILT